MNRNVKITTATILVTSAMLTAAAMATILCTNLVKTKNDKILLFTIMPTLTLALLILSAITITSTKQKTETTSLGNKNNARDQDKDNVAKKNAITAPKARGENHSAITSTAPNAKFKENTDTMSMPVAASDVTTPKNFLATHSSDINTTSSLIPLNPLTEDGFSSKATDKLPKDQTLKKSNKPPLPPKPDMVTKDTSLYMPASHLPHDADEYMPAYPLPHDADECITTDVSDCFPPPPPPQILSVDALPSHITAAEGTGTESTEDLPKATTALHSSAVLTTNSEIGNVTAHTQSLKKDSPNNIKQQNSRFHSLINTIKQLSSTVMQGSNYFDDNDWEAPSINLIDQHTDQGGKSKEEIKLKAHTHTKATKQVVCSPNLSNVTESSNDNLRKQMTQRRKAMSDSMHHLVDYPSLDSTSSWDDLNDIDSVPPNIFPVSDPSIEEHTPKLSNNK